MIGIVGGRLYPLRAVEHSTVWLLGSPRSGSTWLLNLLAAHQRVVPVDEIGIGSHLGVFTSDVIGMTPAAGDEPSALMFDSMRQRSDYVFSDRYARVWRPALRRFLLTRVRAQIADARRGAPLRERLAVIKEPNGSQAARLMLGVLPKSKVLVLLRDGRDVVDSMADALKKDAWASITVAGGASLAEADRLAFVSTQAHRWVARTRAVMEAYERHDPALRFFVRYEDLRADTSSVLRPLLHWLHLPMSEDALEDCVRRLAFEKVPAAHRGSGRFHRAATPGLWRQGLSPAEQNEAARIMGPTLSSLGYSG